MNTNLYTIKIYTKLLNTESILKTTKILPKAFTKGMDLKFLQSDRLEISAVAASKTKKLNLYKEFLNKNYQNSNDIEKLLAENPNSDRNIGRLPDAWIKLLKREEIPAKTKEVQKAFSEFAEQTQALSSGTSGWNKCNRVKTMECTKELRDKLSQIFNAEANVEFIQAGSVGKCFRLTLNGTETALKTFHPIRALSEKQQLFNGRGVEVAMAAYAKKHAAPRSFSTFYMGKVGKSTDDDAYMLTRFITKENAKPYIEEKSIRSEVFYIKVGDNIWDNHIQSTNIEYGNARCDKRFKDWKTRKIAIELADALDANNPKRIDKIVSKYGDSKEFQSAKTSIEEILRIKQSEFNPSFWKLPFPKEAVEALGVSNKYPLNTLLKKYKVNILMHYKYQWKDIDKALKDNKLTDVLIAEDLHCILKESKDKKVLLNAIIEHMGPEAKNSSTEEMLRLGISPKELEKLGVEKRTIKEAIKEIGPINYSAIRGANLIQLKTEFFSLYK